MAKRKKSIYNVILKEFTKINNKLPQERKLSIKDRRKIIKEQLLPRFRDTPTSQIRIKPIKAAINESVNAIPPRELCDLNFIDVASEYAYVEWFAIDETIMQEVPDCVYVKVTAGEFGETRIFNTRNYEYGREGVREIVENIRPLAENMSGRYVFSGYQKLRPRKRNNGNPENYYLDFVLFEVYEDIQGNQVENPMGSTESTRFELPATREIKKKKTKIKKIIEGKVKKLKQVKEKKKRAKKTLDQRTTQFGKKMTNLSKRKNKDKAKSIAREEFLRQLELLEKYKAEGKLTEKQYRAAFDKLFKDYNKL